MVDLVSYVNIRKQILGTNVSKGNEILGQDAETLAPVGYDSAITPLKEKAKKMLSKRSRGRNDPTLSLPWK